MNTILTPMGWDRKEGEDFNRDYLLTALRFEALVQICECREG